MARAYAGILGSGAFAAMVCRGLLHGTQPAAALADALILLVLFSLVGAILGAVAAAAVRHAVLDELRAEVEQLRRDAASASS